MEIPDSSRSNRGEQNVVLMIRPECLQRRFPLLVRPTTIDPHKLEAVYVKSHFNKIQHFSPRGKDDAGHSVKCRQNESESECQITFSQSGTPFARLIDSPTMPKLSKKVGICGVCLPTCDCERREATVLTIRS